MKMFFLAAATISSISCFSQEEARITFGDVPANRFENGKVQNVHTTRATFIRNPRLVAHMPNVTVKEFTFSMLPKGENYYGPFHVKGAELPADLKAKIMTFPEGKVFIEQIKVAEADGTVRVCNPIIFSYSN